MNPLQRELFGSGHGPLATAQPPVRVVFGGLLVTACILAPRGSGAAALLVAGCAALAWFATRAPWRTTRRALLFGALLYVPLVLLLLLPTLLAGAGPALDAALATAAVIALKGTTTLLITLSVATTLRTSELHAALGALPLPRTARLLLIQIAHQAGVLQDEIVRIGQAVALRQARSRGAAVRLLAGVPHAWLERVGARAHRTGAAMDVRGYAEWTPDGFPPPRAWRAADRAALATGAVLLVAGIALHALP